MKRIRLLSVIMAFVPVTGLFGPHWITVGELVIIGNHNAPVYST